MTICARPLNAVELGQDGNLRFYQAGADVFSFDGVYWRPAGCARCFAQRPVGKRIAEHAQRKAAEAARVKAVLQEERRRLHGRRVR